MLASSFLDPVLGLDIHFEMVPTPAPIPLPIPNPFIGLVFDPLGLAAGIALGAVIGAVVGAPFQGPVLYWTAFPATNTGTEAMHIPGHILFPPGVAWAPFPKVPKPVIRPGESPAPGLPIKPENDAIVVFGSKTVTVMGSNAVRLGDIALSCSEPLRLPFAFVLAIPKGSPIVVGGPMSLDVMSALTASLRTRFVSDSLHALLSRLKPSRFRNLLHRTVCFFTGHPVDVASGKVMTEFVDLELPGPLPLPVERIYSSAFASRPGPLGHGWSLSLDQAVWRERGKVVLLAEDGREIEFDTFDFPKHRIEAGQRVENPIERLTLHCDRDETWRVVDHQGVTRSFAPVPGRDDGRAMIQRIVSRCRHHEIGFYYGSLGGQGTSRGRLEWVRDSTGRILRLVHDHHGRVTELHAPHPQEQGWTLHRRYEYDAAGDLVRVTDSRGHGWRFSYVTHLLTQETDRNGLSFYFQYDGLGEDAWCVRTWGDGGIYDHTLGYDKRKHITYVTDSRGHTTQYHMNLAGQVVKVVDPLGGVRTFEHDPTTLMRVAETDALGRVTRVERDAMGHITRRHQPDGTSTGMRHDPKLGLPIQLVLPDGATWQCSYDPLGRLVRVIDSVGNHRQYTWDERGMLRSATTPEGTTTLTHDAHKQLVGIRLANGAEYRYGYDGRGRVVRLDEPNGAVTSLTIDTEGRHLQTAGPLGVREQMAYDPEGHLVRAARPHREVELRRGHRHRVVERVEAGTTVRFAYDPEGHLVRVTNEAGETHRFTLDEHGRVKEETTWDGRTRRFVRDKAGRITSVIDPGGRTELGLDLMDRLVDVRHGDGSEERYAYDRAGRMSRATNADADVLFEHDALGRVTAESQDGGQTWVRSGYSGMTQRIAMHSDLGAHQELERNTVGELTAMLLGTRAVGTSPARIEIARDALGNERGRRLPGGLEVTWQRDALGQPEERVITHPEAGQTFERRRYQWRNEEQIAAIVRDGEDHSIYEHDRRGRLVREEHPPSGRVVDRSMNDVDDIVAGGRQRFGPGGRLLASGQTRYEHDEHGRQVARIEPDGQRWSYHWNGAGLLQEVARPDGTRVRFSYDALARRTAKRVVELDADGTERVVSQRRFVWDGDTVLHELDPSLPPEQGLTTWYWESVEGGPVMKDGPQGRSSVVTDHRGQPTDLFDEQGRRVWRSWLDALGAPQVLEGEPEDCPWRWPGQYEDLETGDFYNRWRYYDPGTGSYRSPDPVGLWGGLRPYAYVTDPLLQIDLLAWFLSIPTKQGHHIIPHTAATKLKIAPFNSRLGVPSFYFVDPPENAHSLMHGFQMGLDSTQRPALTKSALKKQSLDADAWMKSLIDHYSRPELAHLRGDLRIVTSSGSGEVIARNLSPLEAFQKALEWGRERGGCY